MSRSTLDRILGFLTGAISTGLIALILGVTLVEPQNVTPAIALLAIAAMLSILLLRGVPINKVKLNKSGFKIDFEVRNRDNNDGSE